MSKKTKNSDSPTINLEGSDNILAEKIINLSLLNNIKSSNYIIKLLGNQISSYEVQIAYLLKNKPFKFQKKKLNAHYEEVKNLENKIIDCFKKIEEEQESIIKIKKYFPNCNSEESIYND